MYATRGYQFNLTSTLEWAPNNPTVGYIFRRPCPRVCEARESVHKCERGLTWTLIVRGYIIRDIHYVPNVCFYAPNV